MVYQQEYALGHPATVPPAHIFASEFLVADSTSKKTPHFFGPKRCNLFFSN
jgi:hypothetical protein